MILLKTKRDLTTKETSTRKVTPTTTTKDQDRIKPDLSTVTTLINKNQVMYHRTVL